MNGRATSLGGALCWVATSVAVLAQAQDRPPPPNPAPAPKPAAAPAAQPAPSRKPVKGDQARNYEEPPGTEPEDVALFLPRVVLTVPRYAFKIVFFPIRETIRFVD